MNASTDSLRVALIQTRSELARIERDRDEAVAQYLVALFGVEARHRMAGVVRTLSNRGDEHHGSVGTMNAATASVVRPLEADNGSRAVVVGGEQHCLQCDCDECLNQGGHHA